MPINVELTLHQLADVLSKLTPDEFEALMEILDQQNLKARWEVVKQELAEGAWVSEEEIFADLD